MLGMLYFLLLLAISAGIYRSVQGGMQMMIAWILCGAGGCSVVCGPEGADM